MGRLRLTLGYPFPLRLHRTLRVREGEEHLKPLKSIEQAAGLLGISKYTVMGYIRSGMLRPVRLGRRVLLEESELERFVAFSKAQPVANEGSEATPAQMEGLTNA